MAINLFFILLHLNSWTHESNCQINRQPTLSSELTTCNSLNYWPLASSAYLFIYSLIKLTVFFPMWAAFSLSSRSLVHVVFYFSFTKKANAVWIAFIWSSSLFNVLKPEICCKNYTFMRTFEWPKISSILFHKYLFY